CLTLYLVFLERYGDHPYLHSFPTRRSSDLNFPTTSIPNGRKYTRDLNFGEFIHFWSGAAGKDLSDLALRAFGDKDRYGNLWQPRSEEHTSELQSRENLVCRLLLEKKKSIRS